MDTEVQFSFLQVCVNDADAAGDDDAYLSQMLKVNGTLSTGQGKRLLHVYIPAIQEMSWECIS